MKKVKLKKYELQLSRLTAFSGNFDPFAIELKETMFLEEWFSTNEKREIEILKQELKSILVENFEFKCRKNIRFISIPLASSKHLNSSKKVKIMIFSTSKFLYTWKIEMVTQKF